VQGIGQALSEAMVYEAGSGQALTGSLMDYTVPHVGIVAHFETRMDESSPCKNNLLGVKGVGELGTIGATPAVVSAVADALARNGMGNRTTRLQMPLTAPRVWQLMHAA